MKRNRIYMVGAAALFLGLIIGRCTSPGSDAGHAATAAEPATATPAAPTIWTCSMHPQIQQPDPGDCPICAMDLIPLVDDSADLGPRAMTMSESALALAEIRTETVQRAFPEAEVRLVGTLDYDETRVRSLTARFPARIDTLYVNFAGVPVQQGEHLAIVYSPELLIAQRELLTAWRADPSSTITAAAREKLRLWDLLPEQIEAILERNEASDRFELKAPVGGVVVAKNVNEGAYVQTGQPLFTIVDLGELWLRLSAYESDLPWLHYGQEVEFTVESYPGQVFTGLITFIDPELNRRTRTVNVRVNVPNPEGLLKPGMFARGVVRARIAGGGRVYVPELAGKWISPMHPEVVKDGPGSCDVCGMALVRAEDLGFVSDPEGEAPLVVPASAVLRTGKRAVVYLRTDESEAPVFEGREIVLGPRAGDVFLVREGLTEGDRVVTRGAFKIDSALQIQAKPSMMSMDDPVAGQDSGPATPEFPVDPSLLPHYFALQQALAADDLDASRQALRAMMEITGHQGELPDLIHTMLAAPDLDAMRRPHFETLSNGFIAAVRAHPERFTGDIYLMHCPMVYDDRGASWLQPDDDLYNPYFGSMMLGCGDVEENLTARNTSHNGHEH